MSLIDRRSFVSAGIAAGATAWLASRRSQSLSTATASPNETLGIGIIGCGIRGMSMEVAFNQRANNSVVRAICDPNEQALAQSSQRLARLGHSEVSQEKDLRRLLDRKDIDAVAICAPNHWHTLAAVWAMQAGKHVYVEKPATHNLWEGPQLAAAAEKHQRVVQHGIQLRSSPALQEAVQKLRDGAIGDVYMARVLVFKPRKSPGNLAPLPSAPDKLDWNLWQGPAPRGPYVDKLIENGNWHAFWKFGGGELTNQGVHEVDMALWGLGLERLPDRVSALGGSFLRGDSDQAPDTLSAGCRFDAEDKLVEVAVRNGASNTEDDVSIGNIFYGSKGVLLVSGYVRYKIVLGFGKDRKEGRWIDSGAPDQLHVDNFAKAVRAGNPALLNAPIATALPSCGLAHLCNISYRTGQQITYDATSGTVAPGSAEALVQDPYEPGFEITGA